MKKLFLLALCHDLNVENLTLKEDDSRGRPLEAGSLDCAIASGINAWQSCPLEKETNQSSILMKTSWDARRAQVRFMQIQRVRHD